MKNVEYSICAFIKKEGSLVKNYDSFMKLGARDVTIGETKCIVKSKIFKIIKVTKISPTIAHYKLQDNKDNYFELQLYSDVRIQNKKLILL